MAQADKEWFIFKYEIVRTPKLVYSSCFTKDQHVQINERNTYKVNSVRVAHMIKNISAIYRKGIKRVLKRHNFKF